MCLVHASSEVSNEHLRDGADAVNTGGDVGELEVTRLGKVAIEDNVVVVDNGTNNGGHCNTTVLALDSTTALEGLRLRVEPSEGIKDTKGLSDTKLNRLGGSISVQ